MIGSFVIMPFFDKNKKAPGEAKGQKKPRLREAGQGGCLSNEGILFFSESYHT
jgi:hypothetical protein